MQREVIIDLVKQNKNKKSMYAKQQGPGALLDRTASNSFIKSF